MNRDTFDLNAVDWSSVGLMRAAFMNADRDYLEERQRLLLYAIGVYGIAAMPEDGLLVYHQRDESTGRTQYGITLSSCRAITPGGYLVDVVPDPEGRICLPCVGDSSLHPSAGSNGIPIYVGVKRDRASVRLTSARQQHLKDLRFLQTRYVLSTTQREQDIEDWLCIGRMETDASGFRDDKTFIPECLRLDSMQRLVDAVERIQAKAEACLAQLRKHLEGRKVEAAPMTAAMAEATVAIDQRTRPRAYVERLYTVLRTERDLRLLIPYAGLHQKIENGLDEALTRLPQELSRRETDCGNLLRLVEIALGILEEAYRDWDAGTAPPATPGGDVVWEEVSMQQSPQPRREQSARPGLFDGWKKSK